jgi:hypothetical protein
MVCSSSSNIRRTGPDDVRDQNLLYTGVEILGAQSQADNLEAGIHI